MKITASALVDRLLAAGFTEDSFNSNNQWGFGGAVGRRFTRDDVVVKVATAHSRHLLPTKFVTVTVAGRRLYDALQSSDHSRALALAVPAADEATFVATTFGDRRAEFVDASGRKVE
jgi:hypothetical protein